MKIVIVGAGVSGLATYLQLRKVLSDFETHEVSIYDSHQPQESVVSRAAASKDLTDTTAVVGNSIGLTPHSVRLLRYIDEGLYKLFKSRGYVSRSYTFRTARGHTLAVLSSGDGGSPEEYTISCPRYELWKCLYETVGKDKVQHGEVVDVELESDRSIVRFADGATKMADLVIGADGVRSIVKRAIFGREDETHYAPVYE
jgi:2-polyprenyl-6-methoxyphenol hydroxylase-like FAD-dependent oxidoreductase